MRALIIHHDHASPAGPVKQRLEFHGFEIDEILVVEQENYFSPNVDFVFPDAQTYDLLVPMGSPWGVWDVDSIGNWLLPELLWIKLAVESNQAIFGICFGGQLIAKAMGAEVSKGAKAEIGWTWVSTLQPELVGNGPWFQFHYDHWRLPIGANEVALNPVSSQAFTINRALALQFHPEVDAPALKTWLEWEGVGAVLNDGQKPEVMLWQAEHEQEAATLRTFELVDNFLKWANLI